MESYDKLKLEMSRLQTKLSKVQDKINSNKKPPLGLIQEEQSILDEIEMIKDKLAPTRSQVTPKLPTTNTTKLPITKSIYRRNLTESPNTIPKDQIICTIIKGNKKMIELKQFKQSTSIEAETELAKLQSNMFLDFYNTLSTISVDSKEFESRAIVISFTGRGKRYDEVCDFVKERIVLGHCIAAVIVHSKHDEFNKAWVLKHIKKEPISFFFDDQMENINQVRKLNNYDRSKKPIGDFIKCIYFNPESDLIQQINSI